MESDLIKSFKSRVKVDDWTGEPSIVRGACEVVTVPALWRLTAHAELTREHEQFYSLRSACFPRTTVRGGVGRSGILVGVAGLV